jgi:hypothetical protein
MDPFCIGPCPDLQWCSGWKCLYRYCPDGHYKHHFFNTVQCACGDNRDRATRLSNNRGWLFLPWNHIDQWGSRYLFYTVLYRQWLFCRGQCDQLLWILRMRSYLVRARESVGLCGFYRNLDSIHGPSSEHKCVHHLYEHNINGPGCEW